LTTSAAIQIDRHAPSTAIVALVGALARDAREQLVAALAAAGDREHVVVDLSRTDELDPRS
jgi:hypothetical protein